MAFCTTLALDSKDSLNTLESFLISAASPADARVDLPAIPPVEPFLVMSFILIS